jgi:uncharacterized protein YcbX
MAQRTISELWQYPIKSLQGIPLDTIRVSRMGFNLDRRWMIVDDEGTFLSQRQDPTMATLAVDIAHDALHVRSPDNETISIPLEAEERELIPVTIWDSRVDAFTHDPAINAYFSDMLHRTCQLVRIPEAAIRQVDRHYSRKGDHVGFADGFPVLVTCSASLDDLNGKLQTPVPMNRFRPNIVVKTDIPFEEDDWTLIAAGGLPIRIVKPCDRCVIITTDQSTGVRSEEPTRTLATYRARGNGVFFGMNGIPDTEGTLRIGDAVDPS